MLGTVQPIDLSDYLTSDELAQQLGRHRTTLQRQVVRGEITPDIIAPHGVLYWHPLRVKLDGAPPPASVIRSALDEHTPP